ncbi:hypothetical protein H6F86_09825 [Phormidium sp. FACHB-592]|uniref:Uncharacterized protein n=1 Tax=Stenomitos frigidus AS-A4 TaxID=2933935 RepID=A0ABV0KPL2_9CYAN|nr:hypothetical protein [Phormidium sp. FACHB-592]MBD2074184.1 hypothetical protein [Phormidium sp. FACHB-592]
MTALNLSTHRRLQQLPQIASVWEGDRRPLVSGMPSSADWTDAGAGSEPNGECILWVDGSQGMVRAMDVVTPETGSEAVVRTLLRAMEHPHNPNSPARPQKIVVSDRELLFYLRGVLQDLDITLDYVPSLPLIDEIFRGFQDAVSSRPPQLPPQYAEALTQKAIALWHDAPWDIFADHQILAIEVNRWDIDTLYASVMGMLGMEFGVLFYRSLESLQRFRERVLTNESLEDMEEAFLGQDCLFVTFENEGDEEEGVNLSIVPTIDAIEPVFGNLHPLEGLRSFLYDEEAMALMVVLEAFHRFMRQHRSKFEPDTFPVVSSRYRIPLPTEVTADAPANEATKTATIAIKVSTMPDLAAELLVLTDADDDDGSFPAVRDDLVPENSFLSLGVVPWDMLDLLRSGMAEHQPMTEVKAAGDGFPVVMIQTSRPKAKTLIGAIKAAGGLQAICFNPGADPFDSEHYDLGLFQTGNGDLHLFGEFGDDDPTHIAARKKWDQRCKKTNGCCGLIVATGLTGASRGKPQFKDMVALFEARSLTAKDLGLGTLQLRLAADF